MDKPISKIGFIGMSLGLKCRDFFRPRKKILEDLDIKPGFKVLDFGCGPGSYIPLVSEAVGEHGKVCALDIHPLAIEKVKALILKVNLRNVETICSDCATGLPDKDVDCILLYDIFHGFSDKMKVLIELHRVLKDEGFLSFSDHHMKEDDIISEMEKSNLFELHEKKKFTYSFIKRHTA